MGKVDCSIIKTVRVPHEQFESIKNKAKYLMIQDKDNGDVLSFAFIGKTIASNPLKIATHVRGIFVGKDGSMGFKYGKEYEFYTYYHNKCIHLKTNDGVWCPYSNIEKLLENWRILDDN